MKQKFFILIFSLILTFVYQSKVWAITDHIKETTQIVNTNIDKSIFFPSAETPNLIVRDKDSDLWIASIFIPGLGQMLMGDLLRGLKYTLIFTFAVVFIIIGIILEYYSRIEGTGIPMGIGYLMSVAPLIAIVVCYIVSLRDAIDMSKEQFKIIEIEQNLKTTMGIANNIKLSNNGNVMSKALSF